MPTDFRLLWIALAAGSLLLTGCGGGSNLNQQMLLPTQQSQLQRNPYAYATPLQPSAQNASTQAQRGGKAIATPTGYVYEQDSSTNNAAYNFYHSQNPCLYPKPGQMTACAGGSSGYYAGQQQQQGQMNQINQMQPHLAYAQGQYGQAQYPAQPGQLNQGSQLNPYASPYGSATAASGITPGYNMAQLPAGTTNPYGVTNPYASMNNQPIQNNPYASQTAVQPLPQPLPQPQPQPQSPTLSGQSASGSEAQRAQSRIAPDGHGTSGSSTGSSQQKITF